MQQDNAALVGKVALVTGASRGIGRAIALRLGAAGAVVIGTATSEAGAQAIAKTLAEHNIAGTGMCLDVTDAASIDTTIKAINEEFGIPLILVNNAGITKDNILMRMKYEEWHDVIDTNLTSIYRMSKACMRAMTKARFGRIVNISSVVGSMGNAGQANYAAAKAGLEGFTRALARELASRNITVNAVAPGFIDTDMTSRLPEEHRQHLLAQVPLARLGQPEEIAGMVAFLVGNEGGYITGETLHVNGGMHMC